MSSLAANANATPTRAVRTDIPARLDRLPWGRWHWRVVDRARHHLDPRRARGHARRRASAACSRSRHAAPDRDAGRLRRARPTSPARCSARWSSATSPTGSAARGSSWSRSASTWSRRSLTALRLELRELRALPLPHRRRHRRRVRGHQLGHRRADPGARARPRRPRDQRQLLVGAALGALPTHRAARPGMFAADARLAARASASARCSASAILLVRRHVPESPRWLLLHGRATEAERIVARSSARSTRHGTGTLAAPAMADHRVRRAARSASARSRDVMLTDVPAPRACSASR